MKNMKNRKKYIPIIFPLDSGLTKGMAPVNVSFKKGFFFLGHTSIAMDLV